MGMCKGCGEVVSAIEMENGYCKGCLYGVEQKNTDNINDKVDYETGMLEAFVGKPDKYEWYKKSFAKFTKDDKSKAAWNWSWWGFCVSYFFLFYRKAYIKGVLVLLLVVLIQIALPFFFPDTIEIFFQIPNLIIAILLGGYSTYFVYLVYKNKKDEIESTIADEKMRIDRMKKIGGHNSWIGWVVISSLMIIMMLTAVVMSKFVGNHDNAVIVSGTDTELDGKHLFDETEKPISLKSKNDDNTVNVLDETSNLPKCEDSNTKSLVGKIISDLPLIKKLNAEFISVKNIKEEDFNQNPETRLCSATLITTVGEDNIQYSITWNNKDTQEYYIEVKFDNEVEDSIPDNASPVIPAVTKVDIPDNISFEYTDLGTSCEELSRVGEWGMPDDDETYEVYMMKSRDVKKAYMKRYADCKDTAYAISDEDFMQYGSGILAATKLSKSEWENKNIPTDTVVSKNTQNNMVYIKIDNNAKKVYEPLTSQTLTNGAVYGITTASILQCQVIEGDYGDGFKKISGFQVELKVKNSGKTIIEGNNIDTVVYTYATTTSTKNGAGVFMHYKSSEHDDIAIDGVGQIGISSSGKKYVILDYVFTGNQVDVGGIKFKGYCIPLVKNIAAKIKIETVK